MTADFGVQEASAVLADREVREGMTHCASQYAGFIGGSVNTPWL